MKEEKWEGKQSPRSVKEGVCVHTTASGENTSHTHWWSADGGDNREQEEVEEEEEEEEEVWVPEEQQWGGGGLCWSSPRYYSTEVGERHSETQRESFNSSAHDRLIVFNVHI